jgi:hypothetical protein
MSYFTSAKPISKDALITICKEVSLITQVLVAPFGVPRNATAILGDYVSEIDYKSIYRSWEEPLTRKIYAIHDISDDFIAASMQYHIEENNDLEVHNKHNFIITFSSWKHR